MRLFFAIALPPDVQHGLARLQGDSPDYRWVDPRSMHLTLAFLGEQPEDRLTELEEIGRTAAHASNPGLLRLGEAGHFGSLRRPRVLWVDLKGDVDRLVELQVKLTNGLKARSFPTEEREFRAHVTLARRHERATGPAPSGWPPHVETMSFALETLTLMQSRLNPKGAIYTPVFEFKIGG